MYDADERILINPFGDVINQSIIRPSEDDGYVLIKEKTTRTPDKMDFLCPKEKNVFIGKFEKSCRVLYSKTTESYLLIVKRFINSLIVKSVYLDDDNNIEKIIWYKVSSNKIFDSCLYDMTILVKEQPVPVFLCTDVTVFNEEMDNKVTRQIEEEIISIIKKFDRMIVNQATEILNHVLSEYNELALHLDIPKLMLIPEININSEEVHQTIEKLNSAAKILSGKEITKKCATRHKKTKSKTTKNNYSSWK